MPSYVASIEDLKRVQAQLATQLDQLVTAQVGVDATVCDMTDALAAGIGAAQGRVEDQLGELTGILTRSRSLADSARWTGPDSEQFRSGTAQLLATIEQAHDQLLSGVEAHRVGAAALRADVDAASNVFEDAAKNLAVSTGLLDDAVGAETTGYEEAFNGSFRYTGGAAATPPPEGMPSGVPGYTIGPPYRPPVPNDDYWVYGSREPTLAHYESLAAWWLALQAAKAAGVDDGARFYEHFLGASGETLEFDFEEAVAEDPAIRANVNADLTQTAAAVDQIAQGETGFSVNSVASTDRPETENWNLAIGDYQQSSNTTVTVEGDVVTMTATIHADDRFNFHAGASEGFTAGINTDNGQLEESGLARSFNSHGSITRTYGWKLGNPPPAIDVGG